MVRCIDVRERSGQVRDLYYIYTYMVRDWTTGGPSYKAHLFSLIENTCC